jgi:hypothetical protein
MSDDDGKKGDEKKLSDDPEFQELQKAIKGLGTLVSQQTQQNAKLQGNFSSLMEKLDSAIEPGKGKGDDYLNDDDGEEAINDLDNNQLVKLVLGEVGKVIEEKVSGVVKKVDDTNQRFSDSEIKKQIVELGKKDFFDWRDEMADIVKRNPGLQVSELYTLAREKNPEKAAELDTKYQEKKDDEDGSFLSLMPTSGATPGDNDEKLTKEEASERAWQETIEEFPGLANMGEG